MITSAAPPPDTKAARKQKRRNKAASSSPPSSRSAVEPASPSPSPSSSSSGYGHEVAGGPPSASSTMTMMEQQPGRPGLPRSKRNYPSSDATSASGRMRATARAFVRGFSIGGAKRDSRGLGRSGSSGFEAVY